METLSSLKISVNIVDKIDILRELGQELVTDITLKEICFSSRELVIVLFSICDEVISESKVQIKQKKSYYDEKRLRATEIQQRLELFHSVLYVPTFNLFLL